MGPLHKGHLMYGLYSRPTERRITPSRRGLQSPIHNKHTYAISEAPAGRRRGGVLTTPFAVNELSRASIPLVRGGPSRSALDRSLAVRRRRHSLSLGISILVCRRMWVWCLVMWRGDRRCTLVKLDDQVDRTKAAVLGGDTSLLWCRAVEKSRRGVVKLEASGIESCCRESRD